MSKIIEPIIHNERKVYTSKVKGSFRKFYYRHFKSKPTQEGGVIRGKWYKALMIAQDSESEIKYMIYQALYGDGEIYSRPLDMFLSEVEEDKYPDCDSKYRFTSWEELAYLYGDDKVEEMYFNEVFGDKIE